MRSPNSTTLMSSGIGSGSGGTGDGTPVVAEIDFVRVLRPGVAAVPPFDRFAPPLAPTQPAPPPPLEPGLQPGNGFLDAMPILFGKLGEVLRSDDLGVLERRKREAGRRAQQRDALAGGVRTELGERTFVALVEFRIDLLDLGRIIFAFQYRG